MKTFILFLLCFLFYELTNKSVAQTGVSEKKLAGIVVVFT